MLCYDPNGEVCYVPEMSDWDRREALGGDRYGYYGDFNSRSGSSYYDDPRDYREWCGWSDLDDDEGYCDPFLEEVGDDYAIIYHDSGMAVDNTMTAVISSSDSEPVQGGLGGLLTNTGAGGYDVLAGSILWWAIRPGPPS